MTASSGVHQVHIYGLFAYEIFTAAGDLALLLLQQAFAERFMAHYGNVIPLVNQNGAADFQIASRSQLVHRRNLQSLAEA